MRKSANLLMLHCRGLARGPQKVICEAYVLRLHMKKAVLLVAALTLAACEPVPTQPSTGFAQSGCVEFPKSRGTGRAGRRT